MQGVKSDDQFISEENIKGDDQFVSEEDIKYSYADFKRVVNTTRMCRVHAANRLLNTERFVQHINIYYSCFTAIITTLSLLYPDKSYAVASAIMTVVLAISIVYLNAQKYGNRAQQLQTNYIALQQLMYEIENAERGLNPDKILEFQQKYTELLQTSENHVDQDYRLFLWKNDLRHKNDQDYMPKLRSFEKVQFCTRAILTHAFKILMWALPIIYFILVAAKVL